MCMGESLGLCRASQVWMAVPESVFSGALKDVRGLDLQLCRLSALL